MKIRNGFVSNSSSSSFIIEGKSELERVATKMLDIVVNEFGDWDGNGKPTAEDKARYKLWKTNLKKALKNPKVLSGEIGITMPSCNYETYIVQKNDKVYVSTCNNHDWSELTDGASHYGGGSDEGESDKAHLVIKDYDYFNIRNCKVHSIEQYWRDWKNEPKCPKCGKNVFSYVVMDGKKVCNGCYEGVVK